MRPEELPPSRITQRWWNGNFGDMGRERLRIHVHTIDGVEYWSVERENAWERLAYECSDEDAANELVAKLTTERPGDWVRVDSEALAATEAQDGLQS